MTKVGKFVFLIAGAFALCGGKMPLYVLPDTLVPKADVPLNASRTAHPGDELLSADLVNTMELILEAPVSAKITKFEDKLFAGDRLSSMVYLPSEASVLPKGSTIFCGKEMASRSKVKNAIWGNWFSKYDANVRFCYVDTNQDRKLDRVILGGSFDKELQAGYSIDPVAYRVEELQPKSKDDRISFHYRQFKKGVVEFDIVFRKGGADRVYQGYITPERLNDNPYNGHYKIVQKNTSLPYIFSDIFGSSIQIDSVDQDGKIYYRITKNMQKTLVKTYSVVVYNLYVYY